jgi:hypothetical protein
MLGDYLTALLIAVLGYIYPVYLCFKVRARRSGRRLLRFSLNPSTLNPKLPNPINPSP